MILQDRLICLSGMNVQKSLVYINILNTFVTLITLTVAECVTIYTSDITCITTCTVIAFSLPMVNQIVTATPMFNREISTLKVSRALPGSCDVPGVFV